MNTEKMKEARAKAGLSQQQLANICGVNCSMIARIETGSKLPGILLLKQIAHVLGVTMDELMS